MNGVGVYNWNIQEPTRRRKKSDKRDRYTKGPCIYVNVGDLVPEPHIVG
jgi:hypothetical protein